ncbi:MAG: V-type ATP synthase subunit K [Treponema sp.]|nr:MAG: V-type ATP synthase subunit K [Treponema sp.]
MDFGMFGVAAVLGFAGVGSAIGVSLGGSSAIGSWKKCYMNNKPAPFVLVIFAGAPLTQVLYGLIMVNNMKDSGSNPWLLLGIGMICGLAIGASAMAQGKAGAGASDALAETGKGLGLYFTVVGLCETVALLVMAFGLMMLQ